MTLYDPDEITQRLKSIEDRQASIEASFRQLVLEQSQLFSSLKSEIEGLGQTKSNSKIAAFLFNLFSALLLVGTVIFAFYLVRKMGI